MSSQHISRIKLGGLEGRVLRIEGPKGSKSEVLFIYGHHSSLERWQGIAELVAAKASVTMPDLPGFGGMESLYRVGKTASFDNLADWLAEFVRKTYQDRKVTVVGMSLGFVIITRMLQRHPDLTERVEKLVSLFGFADSNDFKMSQRSKILNGMAARFFSLPITSDFYRLVLLNPHVLRAGYHKTKNAKQKFAGLTPEQKRENMEFEIELWHANDLRTHMRTAYEFVTFHMSDVKVNLPVHHIAVHNDRYFNNASVEKHFRQIFSNYKQLAELDGGTHAPTSIQTAEEAMTILPEAVVLSL